MTIVGTDMKADFQRESSRACPRCCGYVTRGRDQWGDYRSCVTCGWIQNLTVIPASHTDTRRQAKRKSDNGAVPHPITLHTFRCHLESGTSHQRRVERIEVDYIVESARPAYACVIEVRGWPHDRWSPLYMRRMIQLKNVFRAETGFANLRNLGSAIDVASRRRKWADGVRTG